MTCVVAVLAKNRPSGISLQMACPVSWGLQFRLLGFKGAVQLQIAMENGPFACRAFVAICSHAAPETQGTAQAPLRKCLCAGSHTEPTQWLLGVSTCGLVHLKAEIQPRATGQ